MTSFSSQQRAIIYFPTLILTGSSFNKHLGSQKSFDPRAAVVTMCSSWPWKHLILFFHLHWVIHPANIHPRFILCRRDTGLSKNLWIIWEPQEHSGYNGSTEKQRVIRISTGERDRRVTNRIQKVVGKEGCQNNGGRLWTTVWCLLRIIANDGKR